jgi:hypothetical protein
MESFYGFTVPEGNELTIGAGVIIGFEGTIYNGGTIRTLYASTIINGGTISNTVYGTIQNDGTIANEAYKTIDNGGTITNGGTIDNTYQGGTIRTSGWIDNNGGAIVNGGTISIAGCGTFSLSIIDGCGIQNDGMIDNKEYGRINLSGMIDNGNYINNHGVITIGRDYQDNPGTIDNRGTIDNGGLIDNDGTIANKEFERNGFIFNGVINNDGVIKSDGTIDNVIGNAIEPRG